MRIFTGRKLHIRSLVFSPDGQHIACTGTPTHSAYDEVRVLEVAGDGLAKCRAGMVCGTVSFTPDGHSIHFPNPNHWYRLRLADGRVELDTHLTELKPDSLAPDGRWVVELDDNESARGVIRVRVAEPMFGRWRPVWERVLLHNTHDGGRPTEDDPWESFAWRCLAANGSRLLLGFRSYEDESDWAFTRVRVLDTATGADVWHRRIGVPVEHLSESAMHADWLVALDRRTLQITDLSSPNSQPLTRTASSRKHFTAAAFSPDGRLLATTSNDTTVTLWDTATWQPARQYAWEVGRLRAVAFAPDGLTCAAGSDTGKVVLFDVDG
jgi:hypothetical protein